MLQSSVERNALFDRLVRLWEAQVNAREWWRDQNLHRLVAIQVSPSIHDSDFQTDLLPVGEATYVSLSRCYRVGGDGRRRTAIRLLGFKSSVGPDGRVYVGGPANNVFGFDLRVKPRSGQDDRGGSVLSPRKVNTLAVGLRLDEATLQADQEGMFAGRLELPQFYVAGRQKLPVEDTPAGRHAVLEVLRPHYSGKPVASTLSPGGVVDRIEEDFDRGVKFVIFAGDRDNVVELPYCARLRPWVQVGTEVAAGAVVADLAPAACYGSWSQLQRAVPGPDDLREQALRDIIRQVVSSHDVRHGPFLLRDVRMCSRQQVLSAVQVFERHLVGPDQKSPVQVVHRSAATVADDCIRVDLTSCKDSWVRRLGKM